MEEGGSYGPKDEEIALRIRERANDYDEITKNYPCSLGKYYLYFLSLIVHLIRICFSAL
jgi:hypothetical protein